MEYIKKEDLIIGETYTHQNGNICRCDQISNSYIIGKHLGGNRSEFRQPPKNPGNFLITEMRLATPEEKHWLETCISTNKFISFEEVMKSFIPEYVECTKTQSVNYEEGKIYKVNTSNKEYSKVENDNGGMAIYQMNLHRFKPSTKEAYDAQFVVKEPEFILPEKWCIKLTEENYKILGKWRSDGELPINSLYYTSSNWYLHTPMNSKNGYNILNKYPDYTEITFKQFKKYVLKEEIVEEVKIIEPLPQFKIIESIETITKVENNEGNQFFIGDSVTPTDGNNKGAKCIIESFKRSKNNTSILAITDKHKGSGININNLEHYIEPKVVELEFILPEKWWILRTSENDKI